MHRFAAPFSPFVTSLLLTPPLFLTPTNTTPFATHFARRLFRSSQGEFDLSTRPVFSEVAQILKRSILALLTSRDPSTSPDDVIVTHCQDLRFCRISSERFVILLGTHHLSRYTDDSGNVASLASDFPPRDRTALYNFEDAASHVDFKTGRMTEVLRYYQNVWDYSRGNVHSYTDAVPGAQYVPLGYVPGLYPDQPSKEKYTDVLFYGRLNNYRSTVIELLRSQGVPVRHLNSGTEGMWGDELRKEIDSAKVVLSLRYFSKAGVGTAQGSASASTEWKFTRFYYPLVAGVPVVSEPCGTTEELKYWSSGVAFAEVSEMADRIKQLLSDAEERRSLAERGKHLLESTDMIETLKEPLKRLVESRGCNWEVRESLLEDCDVLPPAGEPPTQPFNVLLQLGNLVGDSTESRVMITVYPTWAPNAAARFKVRVCEERSDELRKIANVKNKISSTASLRSSQHLVDSGFYDGSKFFFVAPGFAAQVGPHGDPSQQQKWNAKIPDDPVGVQSNERGTVAFATDKDWGRNTQFFVTLGDSNKNLDKTHQPFGKVVSMTGRDGLPTLEKLHSRRHRPNIETIRQEGDMYLEKEFPDLSYIKKAVVIVKKRG